MKLSIDSTDPKSGTGRRRAEEGKRQLTSNCLFATTVSEMKILVTPQRKEDFINPPAASSFKAAAERGHSVPPLNGARKAYDFSPYGQILLLRHPPPPPPPPPPILLSASPPS